MPKRIDPAVKERALRMFAEHRGDYPSDTALAEAVAKKLGGGRETASSTWRSGCRTKHIEPTAQTAYASKLSERAPGRTSVPDHPIPGAGRGRTSVLRSVKLPALQPHRSDPALARSSAVGTTQVPPRRTTRRAQDAPRVRRPRTTGR
jgi:hypothetical protein